MASYPLEPLRALRAVERQASARELGEAMADLRVAEAAQARAEARRAAAVTAVAAARAAAAAALEAGVRVDALARAEAHLERLRRRLGTEDASVARAAAATAAAAAAVDRARDATVGARAREEVVARHHEAWRDDQRRGRDRRDDDGPLG